MQMNYEILYKNSLDKEVLFNKRPPFIVTKFEGLSAPQNILNTETAYGQDGANLTGQRYDVRNLTIEGKLVAENSEDRQSLRIQMNNAFSRDLAGTLYYKEGDKTYSIDVLVEHAPIFIEDTQRPYHVSFQIVLKALNPYWIDESLFDSLIPLTTTENLFEFPLNITPDFEFATIRSGDIIKIMNGGDIRVGAVFHMKFRGEVTNPRIYNVLTQEYIGFEGTYQPSTEFIFSTVYKEKSIIKTEDGFKENGMPYRMEDSSFIMLDIGENYLQVQADEGVNSVIVNVQFRPLVIGI